MLQGTPLPANFAACLPLVTRSGIHPSAKLLRDPADLEYTSFSKVVDRVSSRIEKSTGDYDIPDSGVPIFNQGNLGACVLNATTRSMMVELFVEQKTVTRLSRLFGYWLCSKAMGTVGQDTGTYVHLAVERYGSIGICDESIWPYTDDPSTFFVPPELALQCVLEGSDNRPKSWAKIDETDAQTKLAQMEAAVRANHPVSFGTPVSSAIQNYVAGQVLGDPDPSTYIGGHSMHVTGVHYINGSRVWVVTNSWGPQWGMGGRCLVSDEWATDPQFSDLWIMSSMDDLLF